MKNIYKDILLCYLQDRLQYLEDAANEAVTEDELAVLTGQHTEVSRFIRQIEILDTLQ